MILDNETMINLLLNNCVDVSDLENMNDDVLLYFAKKYDSCIVDNILLNHYNRGVFSDDAIIKMIEINPILVSYINENDVMDKYLDFILNNTDQRSLLFALGKDNINKLFIEKRLNDRMNRILVYYSNCHSSYYFSNDSYDCAYLYGILNDNSINTDTYIKYKLKLDSKGDDFLYYEDRDF